MEKYVAALTLAIQNWFPDDIIQYIYQQVCRMSSPVPFEINVLWPAVYHHSANSVRILLKLGANVNHRMPETGSTPIMYAAQNSLTEIVSTLLENGADISLKSDAG